MTAHYQFLQSPEVKALDELTEASLEKKVKEDADAAVLMISDATLRNKLKPLIIINIANGHLNSKTNPRPEPTKAILEHPDILNALGDPAFVICWKSSAKKSLSTFYSADVVDGFFASHANTLSSNSTKSLDETTPFNPPKLQTPQQKPKSSVKPSRSCGNPPIK